MSKRVCVVCGADLYGKRTWAAWRARTMFQRLICMACGAKGYRLWLDGSVYNRNEGPSPGQRAQLAAERGEGEAP